MRKIFSLTLIVILMLNLCVCSAYAAEDTEFSTEVRVLNKLGVFSFEEDEEIDYEKKVSRAEFAGYTVRALALPESGNAKVYFTDVPTDFWAASEINTLVEIGAICGTGSKSFNPDDYVTYGQSLKMMLAAAGYKTAAEESGEELYGYERLAARLGIRLNIADGEGLSLKQAAEVIYSCMLAEPVLQTTSTAVAQSGKTIFSEYRGVYFGEGVLETFYGGSVNQNSVSERNKIFIDGKEYSADSDIDASEYFGANTKFVCIKEKDDDYRVIYMEKTEEDISISSLLIDGYDKSKRELRYYKSDSALSCVTRVIPAGVSVIVNGTESSKTFGDIINEFVLGERKGSIRLLKDKSGAVFRVIVKSYRYGTAELYDSEKNTLYINDGGMEEIKLYEYEMCNIIDEFGAKKELPFEVDTPVFIAESEENRYIELVNCMSAAEGEISDVRHSDREIVIDNKTYTVDKKYWEKNSDIFKAGRNIKAKLDIVGEIVYAKYSNTGEMQYGYLTDATIEGGIFDNRVVFKMYFPDEGTLEKVTTAEKLILDGENYKKDACESILEAIPGTELSGKGGDAEVSIERQLVRFRKNENNEITELDTYKVGESENRDNTLTRRHDGTTQITYNQPLKRFGMDTAYDSQNTKLIFVPHTNADGNVIAPDGTVFSESLDMYGVKVALNTSWDYYIQSYYDNSEAYYASAIVIEVEYGRRDDTIFMYDRTDEIYENDEVKKCVVGMSGGGAVSYIIPEGFENLMKDISQGDILSLTVDTTGKKIATLKKMYDCSDKKMVNSSGNPYWYEKAPDETGKTFDDVMYQLSRTHVYSLKNGYVQSTYYMYDMDKGIVDEVLNVSGAPIVVYDAGARDGKVKKGSVSDIKGFKTAGDDCSIMLVQMNYQNFRQVFIYNY